MEMVQQVLHPSVTAAGEQCPQERSLLDEERFRNLLALECERAELCKRQILLMQIDLSGLAGREFHEHTARVILSALYSKTREKDLKGWLDANKILGIIFPNLDPRTAGIVLRKIRATIGEALGVGLYPAVTVSHSIFPAQA
jgi:hypothetical protein